MNLEEQIFKINSPNEFNDLALKVFQWQAKNNPVYREFVDELGTKIERVNQVSQIPFLPISLFKTHTIKSGNFDVEKTFLSSGTTQNNRSKHHIKSLKLYEQSFLKTFSQFFGDVSNLTILCLLPSYQEQGDSSLLYMTDFLIKASKNKLSGYFLNQNEKLFHTIEVLERENKPFVLFGVSYALLDYLDTYKHTLSIGKIIETGGMKGRRKELTKEQLHIKLEKGFGTNHICSEYGMTELLSQAYSLKNQTFHLPNWMSVMVRDTTDPFHFLETGKTGLINVIDLANIYSCSFIATDDVGVLIDKNQFKIKGRYDLADVRGCNLLVQ